jgi:hypothetical protein
MRDATKKKVLLNTKLWRGWRTEKYCETGNTVTNIVSNTAT